MTNSQKPARRGWDALLADRQAPSSPEPVPRPGPSFDDAVSEPEALLSSMTSRSPEQGPNSRMPVASGTSDGYLFRHRISHDDDLILTNHHVLFPKHQVANVHADLDSMSDSALWTLRLGERGR